MLPDCSTRRLGKQPVRCDARTLKLARYLTGALPEAPPLVDYTRGLTDWGMMLNDRLGCCTIAAAGHALQVWTYNATGRELTVPDSTILDYYEKWDGYDPGNPASDQGGVELDVLNNWRQDKFDGNSLDAFVAIDLHDGARDTANRLIGPWGRRAIGTEPVIGRSGDGLKKDQQCECGKTDSFEHGECMGGCSPDDPITRSAEVLSSADSPITGSPDPLMATAIWLFGGAYIGLELPRTAQNQDVWDVQDAASADAQPGSWGGHAVYVVGFDFSPNPESRIPNPGLLTCITWGRPKKMTLAFFQRYCSEAYALVSKDWIESTGLAPSGFDFATLENDLSLVTA